MDVLNRRKCLKGLAMAPVAAATWPSLALTPAWGRAADMPLSTQELYPASHNGELVVAGGIASKAGVPYFTDRCVAFDPVKDSWREHSTLPEACHHAALVTANSRLFLLGGFNGGYTHVWRMRDTIHEYVDGSWKHLGKLPHRQAEGVVATSEKLNIHVVTGQRPKGEANKKRSDHHETHNHFCWNPDDSN